MGGTTNDDDARIEWASLRRLLDRFPDDATVWPGHDYGVRPSSTIGLERATNPFLRCPDLAAFIALKQDWPTVTRLLLRDRFAAIDQIQRIRVPLGVIAGGHDRIVPIEYSLRLYDAAMAPKTLLVLANADHNDYELLAGDEMIQAIVRFLQLLM